MNEEYDPRAIDRACRREKLVKRIKRLAPIAAVGFVIGLFIIMALRNPTDDLTKTLAAIVYLMLFLCLAILTALFYVLCSFRP